MTDERTRGDPLAARLTGPERFLVTCLRGDWDDVGVGVVSDRRALMSMVAWNAG